MNDLEGDEQQLTRIVEKLMGHDLFVNKLNQNIDSIVDAKVKTAVDQGLGDIAISQNIQDVIKARVREEISLHRSPQESIEVGPRTNSGNNEIDDDILSYEAEDSIQENNQRDQTQQDQDGADVENQTSVLTATQTSGLVRNNNSNSRVLVGQSRTTSIAAQAPLQGSSSDRNTSDFIRSRDHQRPILSRPDDENEGSIQSLFQTNLYQDSYALMILSLPFKTLSWWFAAAVFVLQFLLLCTMPHHNWTTI